jgi:alpha-tubulin suppressor-like RCC1 family protein
MSRSALSPARVLSVLVSLGLMAASLTLTAAPAAAAVAVPVITSIASGYSHTCAVTDTGGVKCWGYNGFGQLGDGTRTERHAPVDVAKLASGIVAVSAGFYDTCALTSSGGVKCWGWNAQGQLGTGTHTDRHVPVNVIGLTRGVAAISVGVDHTCALTVFGGVTCWGANYAGQLGDGTTTGETSPVDVSGLTSGVASISAGDSYTCAVTVSGDAKCWGDNFNGQLGDGTTNSSSLPVDVTGSTSGVASISAGIRHTCEVMTSGGVKCWGNNASGQLGDGTRVSSNLPVDVLRITSGVSVSVGESHSCALLKEAYILCWGNNTRGQLGIGNRFNGFLEPLSVSRIAHASALSAGGSHACAIVPAGHVKCWGLNARGEVGNGSTLDSLIAAPLFGPVVTDIENSLSTTDPITNAGQIAVTTSWTGVDPYATITSYAAQVQVNGGDWTDVTLANPSDTSVTIILTAGGRYNFQLSVTDSRGLRSDWIPGTSFTLTTAQENDVFYTGAWVAQPLAGAWGGSVRSSTDSGASALFRWHGRSIALVGTVGPEYGSADVYVDGAYVSTIDASAGSTLTRQTLFRSSQLDSKKHTLQIVNLGSAGHPRIDIDGFVQIRS